MVTVEKNLLNVINNGYCVGCGVCAATGEVQLGINSKTLVYEPLGPGGSKSASICPSIKVNYSELQQKLFPHETQSPLGVVRQINLAQSTNEVRNLKASSGGIIKEILYELLSEKTIDGAIALQHEDGLIYEPKLTRNADDVDNLPGSIYHNISFEKALSILKANDGKYAIVAIPCQLEGLYNYIFEIEPELIHRIYCTIGLICGWTYTHHSILSFCHYKKLDFNKITNIAFRGDGPKGLLQIEFRDKVVKYNRNTDLDYIVAFDRSSNLPRCHLCVNHINYLADIVVGDAWLKRVSATRTGVSIVISRSATGQQIFQTLINKNKIVSLPASETDIEESQGRNFTYGDLAYSYGNFLRQKKMFTPNLIGPNLSKSRPVALREIINFDRENRKKILLQHNRSYWQLWFRKIGKDALRYLLKFLKKRSQKKKNKKITPETMDVFR